MWSIDKYGLSWPTMSNLVHKNRMWECLFLILGGPLLVQAHFSSGPALVLEIDAPKSQTLVRTFFSSINRRAPAPRTHFAAEDTSIAVRLACGSILAGKYPSMLRQLPATN